MAREKYKTITISEDDFNLVKSWQEQQYGLTTKGAMHQIIEEALKQRKLTHRNKKGKFDGKG